MNPVAQVGQATLYCGDSREVLESLLPGSIDSVVTDPPYELGFMGKSWDASSIAYDATMWKLVYVAMRPGAHLLAFGGSRTHHRLACAIEDAGFEIRDQIMWLYSSGFPKSHNLSGKWEGWGTALKPAHEPIVVARKPLIGTVAENVRTLGTGALNIDGCRVAGGEGGGREGEDSAERRYSDRGSTSFKLTPGPRGGDAKGRWPANIIHDGSEEIVSAFPLSNGQQGAVTGREPSSLTNNCYGKFKGRPATLPRGDSGSAARFFYCAKASRKDRDEGCGHLEKKSLQWSSGEQNPGNFQSPGTERAARNYHPTVKPTALMRYLCRLVTPPGGVTLDPFMGSGSTGKAALMEGFQFIGIEREPEYFEIARSRMAVGGGQPETILQMPKPDAEPQLEPDLFGFDAA